MADTTGLEPATSAVTVQRSKPTELRIQFLNCWESIFIFDKCANFFLVFFSKKIFLAYYKEKQSSKNLLDCSNYLYLMKNGVVSDLKSNFMKYEFFISSRSSKEIFHIYNSSSLHQLLIKSSIFKNQLT